MTPNNSEALLNYLIQQSSSQKNWFGFLEQRIAGVDLAYKIAANHADKLSPQQIVAYVKILNDEIYEEILKAK
jgi:hypothetical protein